MASRTPPLDYYEILGLPRDAGQEEIESAFRTETVRVRDLPGSGEQMRRIGLAYRALSNPERRRDYDAALSGAPPAAAAGTASEADAAGVPADDVGPPEPTTTVQSDEEAPRRTGGRGLLLGLAAGALFLLLLAGLWAGGLFGSDPQVAGESANRAAPSAAVADAARNQPVADEEGGSLADALSSLLPSSSDEQEVAAAAPPPPAPAEVAEAPAPAPATGSEAPARSAETASAAQPPATEEPTRPAPTQPAAEPPRAAPTPPPAPAVDRSSGPRLLSGGLVDADNQGGRFQGSVSVRLQIGANGRAQGCSVTRSSGNAALDSTTCRLLQERLVFNPARDRNGNPVATEVESTHVWGRQRRR